MADLIKVDFDPFAEEIADIVPETKDSGTLTAVDYDPFTEEPIEETTKSIETPIVDKDQQDEFTLADPKDLDKTIIGKSIRTLYNLKGATDAGLTVTSAALKETAAGLRGLWNLGSPWNVNTPYDTRLQQSIDLMEDVRKTIPTYESGNLFAERSLSNFASLMSGPAKLLEESREALGESVFKSTNSPGLATAAYIAPDITLELLGSALPSGATKTIAKYKNAKLASNTSKMLTKVAPTTEELFGTSRAIFKEIDEVGATIKADKFMEMLVGSGDDSIGLAAALDNAGMDAGLTPKAARMLDIMYETFDDYPTGVPLSELEKLRRKAKKVAANTDKAESSLGMQIIDAIDDFVEQSGTDIIQSPSGTDASTLGRKYRVARDLWARGRRSELIQRAFDRAKEEKNFEKALTTEFKNLLKNDKTKNLFSETEKEALRTVTKGTGTINMARVLGSLGIYESGGQIALFRPMVGMAAGTMAAGPAAGFAVPVIGQVSKALAQKLVKGQGEFADAIIRASNNGEDIVKAYLKYTPKAEQRATELAELLTRGGTVPSGLPNTALVNDAIDFINSSTAAWSSAYALDALANIPNQMETKE